MSTGFDLHLTSPRPQKPVLRANRVTLVDCFTYGLKVNRGRIDPVAHYEWYVDFVKEHQNERDMVFIAPDWEWLSDTRKLNDKWLMSNENAKVLVVPDSFLFDKCRNVVGHGLKPFQNKAHEEWTHSFSQFHAKALDGETRLWTFDTQGYEDVECVEKQRSVSFQASLRRLRLI